MSLAGWLWFVIVVAILVILGVAGYIFYARYRANKAGLPPPSWNPFRQRGTDGGYRAPAPAPKGIRGWLSDQWQSLRSGRTAAGAYEGAGAGGARGYNERRGFGALDPDEAWNARVDDETGGYYEEQELGLQDPSRGPYGGGGYGDAGPGGLAVTDPRGRSRSRSREGRLNPFGDEAEASSMSLRSVSPRPDTDATPAVTTKVLPGHKRVQSNLSAEESPTERRSMFREEV